MLAGIMAIFEMGLALTGRSLLPAPPDTYLSNAQHKLKDRRLLALLSNPDAVASELDSVALCQALRDAYGETYVPTAGSNPRIIDLAMPITSGRWTGACVINDGTHRVVVTSDALPGSSPYRLFSCDVRSGNDQCSFEND